jgi:formate dehydrogenase subunit delta
MRQAIFTFIDAGGDGLEPLVREAILHLKEHSGKKGYPTETSFRELEPSPFGSCG